MRSKSSPDLDLTIDASPEDIEALERVKAHDHLDPVAYLRFLQLFADRHPPTREIPPRHEPFVL